MIILVHFRFKHLKVYFSALDENSTFTIGIMRRYKKDRFFKKLPLPVDTRQLEPDLTLDLADPAADQLIEEEQLTIGVERRIDFSQF